MRLAAAAAWLALATALAGCQTTADSLATVGLHGGAGAVDALAAAPADDAAIPGATDPAAEEGGYYVEFRARPGGPLLGHIYMIYGRTDSAGRLLEENFIGFYPKGGVLGLAAGTAPLPIPAELGKVWGDEKLPILASYHTTITAQQYRNVLAFTAQARQNVPSWNLWVYNCNNFAADFARAAGLEAPAITVVAPPIFVAALRAMNENGESPDAMLAAHQIPLPGYERRSLND